MTKQFSTRWNHARGTTCARTDYGRVNPPHGATLVTSVRREDGTALDSAGRLLSHAAGRVLRGPRRPARHCVAVQRQSGATGVSRAGRDQAGARAFVADGDAPAPAAREPLHRWLPATKRDPSPIDGGATPSAYRSDTRSGFAPCARGGSHFSLGTHLCRGSLAVHEAVFAWILELAANQGPAARLLVRIDAGELSLF